MGIAQGLNKGHIVTLRPRKAKQSERKGKLTERSKVVKEVVRECVGFAPYERRMLELLKIGSPPPSSARSSSRRSAWARTSAASRSARRWRASCRRCAPSRRLRQWTSALDAVFHAGEAYPRLENRCMTTLRYRQK